jgi:hypothetical protein
MMAFGLSAIYNYFLYSVAKKTFDPLNNLNITALFKKGDKAEPGNYRPVSLTSVVCKTMEKLVREIIVKHMSANKLFNNLRTLSTHLITFSLII